VTPATVTVALRAPPEFDTAVTVALPEPLPLPLTDAHADPLDEVQLHPELAVTATVKLPPPDWKLSDVGETL
jgi:hypothetical protein